MDATVESTDAETDTPWSGQTERDWRTLAAPGGVSLLAAALLAGFTWNFLREIETLSAVGPPAAVFLFGAALSLGIGWWAERLRTSDFPPADRWAVALWTVGGTVALTAVVALTLWIRFAEGRTVEEPQLTVLVGAASGGHLGALAGHYYAAARQRAAETERAREALAFLNRTIRHEVLNGMTVIEGNASRVRNADDPGDALGAIEAESRDISERMRDVQEVVGVLSGETDVDTVDLSAMVEDRVAVARNAHPDARVEASIEPGITVDGADPLEHAVDNLIGNAVEHGTAGDGAGPTVEVTVAREGAEGVVAVTDDGPGVPEEELASLFEPDDGGTHGFGLYLVRTLAEQCGGRATAHNHADDDRGAVFELRLPLA